MKHTLLDVESTIQWSSMRGLAQRGKLSTEHRALNFIAKLGERGVVWHILTYWRPTE